MTIELETRNYRVFHSACLCMCVCVCMCAIKYVYYNVSDRKSM
jgi:hypothetical protein